MKGRGAGAAQSLLSVGTRREGELGLPRVCFLSAHEGKGSWGCLLLWLAEAITEGGQVCGGSLGCDLQREPVEKMFVCRRFEKEMITFGKCVFFFSPCCVGSFFALLQLKFSEIPDDNLF